MEWQKSAKKSKKNRIIFHRIKRTANTMAQEHTPQLPDPKNIPYDAKEQTVFDMVAPLSPAAIAKMAPLNEDMAKTFFQRDMHRQLNDGQAAALALSQPRKLMSEDRAVAAINRFMKFEDRIAQDILELPTEDKDKVLEKVLAGRPAYMPVWPTELKEVAQLSAKQLAEMPSITRSQAAAFYEQEIHKLLNPQQKAVVALSQHRTLMPVDAAIEAINSLKLPSGEADLDALLGRNYPKSQTVLAEVMAGPALKNVYQAATHSASRMISMLGIKPADGKKPAPGLGH